MSKTEYALLQFLSACVHKTEFTENELSQDEWKELMILAHVHNVLPLNISIIETTSAKRMNGI